MGESEAAVAEQRLIDANALIAQIEKNICEPCKERKQDYNGVRCRACQYGDEMDDIEDAPTVMEWIPCSERLPEKEGRYLVTCEKCGAWSVDWNIWADNKIWLWEQGVSAWMPLPEPYKEGEK